jgi:serine protease Do
VAGAETEEGQPTSYSDYTVVKDESNIIQVEVPVEWSQVNDSPWTRDGQNVGVGISASADLNRFAEYYDQPGIDFLVSRQIAQTTNEDQLLAQFDQSENCTKANSKEPYDDGLYTGV